MARRAFAALALVAVAGCSGLYSSPKVSAGEADVGAVNVVQITATSVAQANAEPYKPRELPAVFTQTAGVSGSARGAGALPEPAFTQEDRPAAMVKRLPPPYTPGSYRIGAGDVILLSTPSSGGTLETLTGLLAAQNSRQGYVVQDDGAITIPQVGRVRLAGLTVEEAEAEVFQALAAQQIDPTFSLEIAEFNSQRVALGGAVGAPKTIAITIDPITLAEAISAGGGITLKDQSYATIRLYRDDSLYQIPLQDYLEDPIIQRMPLKDRDIVYVDSAFDLDKAQGYFSQQLQLASFRQSSRQAALTQLETEVGLRRGELSERRATFLSRVDLDAVERDYVYIAGEVGVQNRFTLPFNRAASLADALFDETRGVPNRTGNISELYVIRAGKDGTVTAWRLDASNAANLVLATRFELRPNDVVFVAEQPVTALDRLISQLAPSVALARSF